MRGACVAGIGAVIPFFFFNMVSLCMCVSFLSIYIVWFYILCVSSPHSFSFPSSLLFFFFARHFEVSRVFAVHVHTIYLLHCFRLFIVSFFFLCFLNRPEVKTLVEWPLAPLEQKLATFFFCVCSLTTCIIEQFEKKKEKKKEETDKAFESTDTTSFFFFLRVRCIIFFFVVVVCFF